ncbi:MAG: VOC family protein, partial [Alphaproteobacteria bacterium]|nr:VOC family protein [Alphaproteobacteria bacterium]
AAFRFYEKALGGTVPMMMKYGESPMKDQTPPEFRDKVMHTRLIAGDAVIMGSDAPPGRYEKTQGITVAIAADTAQQAERIFHALAEKGTVQMPIAETFWAVRFGMLTDQFGIPWMINCEKPMG